MSDVERVGRGGALFELIGDPVAAFELVDGEPIVRAVNPAFEATFGYDPGLVVGESLNDFVVPEPAADEAARFDRRTAAGESNVGFVTRETADGLREFLYRGIPYERDGRRYGFAVYVDVTEQRRYERHMRVVHRLLRHDLRNHLQVIRGGVDRIDALVDDDRVAERVATVLDHVEALTTVGEETRIVERVLLDDHRIERIDAAELCRRAARAVREAEPAATIDVSAPESLPVEGVTWLERAVRALVENAAVHAGDAPEVTVTARREGDRAVVAVTDDGPGIPVEQRRPVFDNGAITDLGHNHGVGLWMVRWIVEACEGRLTYDREDGHTVVRLWLSTADDS